MSAIDTLIKIKKQVKTDDLIRLLDEIIIYKKLSKSKLFQDWEHSPVAKAKMPLLVGAYAKDEYSLALSSLAIHILEHLGWECPSVLTDPLETLTSRQMSRLKILQDQIVPVQYYTLWEYDDEKQHDQVIAVYIKRHAGSNVAALILVRNDNQYQIYEGFYTETEEDVDQESAHIQSPYIRQKSRVLLMIKTYSIQGNNAYPFGVVTMEDRSYLLSQPDYQTLYLASETEDDSRTIKLSMADRNEINMARASVDTFANALLTILVRELENIDEKSREIEDDSAEEELDRKAEGIV